MSSYSIWPAVPATYFENLAEVTQGGGPNKFSTFKASHDAI